MSDPIWPTLDKQIAHGCWHDRGEADSDEHRAGCLDDAAAALRLAERESFWDSYGTTGYEL